MCAQQDTLMRVRVRDKTKNVTDKWSNDAQSLKPNPAATSCLERHHFLLDSL